jgi:preprotein translocase subunit SecD
MPRNQKISALVVIGLALVGMAYTLIAGNQPLLGLDLQGGVSVVLQPTEPAEDEALEQAIAIIRNRVDALGVAEPEISRQGDNIVVDLPGVQEQQRALELVGQTAELRFRPVVLTLAPPTTAGPLDEELPVDPDGLEAPEPGLDPEADAPAPEAETEESLAEAAGPFGPAMATPVGLPADDEDPATGDGPPADDPAADDEPIEGADELEPEATPEQQAAVDACFAEGATLTAREDDRPQDYVLLTDDRGVLYCLGPTLLTGESIESALATPLSFGEWEVRPTFRAGPQGIDLFNQAAALCFAGDPNTCPTRQLAIVLDGEVIVAPTINAPTFLREQITITGGFSQNEAQDVATVLRYGALPVELEPQQTRTVSATIGEDALQAGVIAGIIGLGLVALYLLAYYRLAGLVVISGLAISGMLLWTIIAWFGETQGLALTTAGIVGIIVAIGVSADSNIVYFENVKDAMRGGRTLGTSIERAYRNSISTIIKADVVALIAAGLLYWLTVGAVRGFAFYLGLATLLDLFVAWFFMRPALNWVSRSPLARQKPSRLGLPATPVAVGGST